MIAAISADEFERIAQAAIDAVAWVEGWADNHPSIVYDADENPRPSRRFKAELRANLKEQGFTIQPKARVA